MTAALNSVTFSTNSLSSWAWFPDGHSLCLCVAVAAIYIVLLLSVICICICICICSCSCSCRYWGAIAMVATLCFSFSCGLSYGKSLACHRCLKTFQGVIGSVLIKLLSVLIWLTNWIPRTLDPNNVCYISNCATFWITCNVFYVL